MKTEFILNGEVINVADFQITEQNPTSTVFQHYNTMYGVKNPQGQKVLADLKIKYDISVLSDYNKLYSVYTSSSAFDGRKVEANFTTRKMVNGTVESIDYLLMISQVIIPTEYEKFIGSVSPENSVTATFKLELVRKSIIQNPLMEF